MTAPIWMAMPPETHSAMLTAGPGPGPLLAAAAQWQQLSAVYGDTATELTQVLATVQTGQWQGTGATAYLSAHTPYLTWLQQAAVDTATTAVHHHHAAAAYSTALATMPSLAELAANHAVHGVLVATNFFGVNTIPIALNEADYTRMWVQAAETMTLYQAAAGAAVAATPQLPPAPPILAGPAAATESDPTGGRNWPQELARLLAELLENAGNAEAVTRIFENFFESLGFNPATAAILAGIALVAYEVVWIPYYASYGLLLLPFFLPALSALSALKLLPLLSGAAFTAEQPPHPVSQSPAHARPDIAAATVPPPASTISAAGPGGGTVPATNGTSVITPTGGDVAALLPYLVSGWGPPGLESGPRGDMAAATGAAVSRRATTEREAAVDARIHRSRRSRGRARMQSHRYEFLPATEGASESTAPDTAATARLAPAAASATGAAGLAQPAANRRAQVVPLLPSTWADAEVGEPVTQPMKDSQGQ
ncbi:PPE family protein [Mycolicibacter minnesotensis]